MSGVIIESRHNAKIKELLKLQKGSERKKSRLFSIEGILEIEKAINSQYDIISFFYNSEILIRPITDYKGAFPEAEVIEVSREIYNYIAYRENSGGIVAVARSKEHGFQNLNLRKNILLLVVEGVEKPGNIGAIFRTADAAGIDGVILCNPLADIYNSNAIRASIGTVFSVPTIISSTKEAISFLKENDITIYSTYLEASKPYHTMNYKNATAIVVGTEATGISNEWVNASDANIIIPMNGQADSLNVSVSAAIVLFEACRQRNFIMKSK